MATEDVVGVFDQNGNELFEDARSVRAQVIPRAKVPKHTLETGATTSDHVIFENIEIQLSVICTPDTLQDTFGQIKNLYDNPQLVTVVTTVDSYDNMLLAGYPYNNTAEMADTVAIGLKFSEFPMVQAQTGALPASMVKNPSDASTVKTGVKNAGEPTTQQSSTFYDLLFGSGPR